MSIYEEIKSEAKRAQVKLIAVSKTKPIDAILNFYHQGQLDFGENRIQELQEKIPAMPSDIKWHMIGHLQTNKVKYIAEHIHMIHSIDSVKLLSKVNTEAKKHERVIPVLLEFKIATEDSKHGFDESDLDHLFVNESILDFPNVTISGVMGMASFTSNQEQVRAEFKKLKTIFDTIKSKYCQNNEDFREISMGMSGDYPLAIEEGSTMIRVGSKIFGSRN